MGLRVAETDSGVGQHDLINDGVSPGSSLLVDHNITAKTVAHVYVPGLEQRDGQMTGALHLMGVDALGSVRAFINDDLNGDGMQSVTDTQSFDGYGITRTRTGSDWMSFGFAGAEGYQTDPNQLMLLGNREYHPFTGRFLTRDPAGAGSNDYEYADDSPTNEIDPSGLDPMKSFDEPAGTSDQAIIDQAIANGAAPGSTVQVSDAKGNVLYSLPIPSNSGISLFRLPQNPAGLPPGWQQIPHGAPGGGGVGPNGQSRWVGPNGKGGLEHHPKTPGAPSNTHRGQDGWHILTPKAGGGWQTGDTQYPVGTEIPNPDQFVDVAAGTAVIAGGGYLLWTGAKWTLATLAAPETGGLSLLGAALSP